MLKKLIIFLIIITAVVRGIGQSNIFRIEGDEMILQLDRRWDKAKLDSVLNQFDMKKLSVDSAWRFGNAGRLASEGWQVRKTGKNKMEVFKPVSSLPRMDIDGVPICLVLSMTQMENDSMFISNSFMDSVFGRNEFENISVTENQDGVTEFNLQGHLRARSVMLSGSFNNWSTSGLQMQKTNDGWIARVKLIPGRYEYKFIVDGKWMRDSQNILRADDNAGDYNSVYYKTNYTFRLKNVVNAKKVILAGTFNNWDENELQMEQIGDDRILDVFLPLGTYQYKFIVDGVWQTDPSNSEVRPDANGYMNSYLSIGEPTLIQLNGFSAADKVVLSGSFNNWNEEQFLMTKTNSGWELPYVLRPGVYEYKFIVDGRWTTDPLQPEIPNENPGERNNFLVVKPNHFFGFKNEPNIKTVAVTGSFCDWRESGIPLTLHGEEWVLPYYLPKGKHTYKFIVNGEWKLDANNPIWEENEFGTGNSVLWVN